MEIRLFSSWEFLGEYVGTALLPCGWIVNGVAAQLEKESRSPLLGRPFCASLDQEKCETEKAVTVTPRGVAGRVAAAGLRLVLTSRQRSIHR